MRHKIFAIYGKITSYWFILQEPDVVVKEFMNSKPIMSEIEAQIKYYQVSTICVKVYYSLFLFHDMILAYILESQCCSHLQC